MDLSQAHLRGSVSENTHPHLSYFPALFAFWWIIWIFNIVSHVNTQTHTIWVREGIYRFREDEVSVWRVRTTWEQQAFTQSGERGLASTGTSPNFTLALSHTHTHHVITAQLALNRLHHTHHRNVGARALCDVPLCLWWVVSDTYFRILN